MDQALFIGLIMLICVVIMLIMGVPISISIGAASVIAMFVILPF